MTNCYLHSLHNTCIMDYITKNFKHFVILIHPIPYFVETIKHDFSRGQPIAPFFTHQNEIFHGFAYKIHEMYYEHENYQFIYYTVF